MIELVSREGWSASVDAGPTWNQQPPSHRLAPTPLARPTFRSGGSAPRLTPSESVGPGRRARRKQPAGGGEDRQPAAEQVEVACSTETAAGPIISRRARTPPSARARERA